VSFVPQAGNKDSTPGVDQTGPEGNYLLRFKGRTGVAPGKYKVTITPGVELPPDAKVPAKFKNDPMMLKFAQEAQASGKKAGGAESKKEVIKGEFDAEVPDGASTTLDFDVKVLSSAGGHEQVTVPGRRGVVGRGSVQRCSTEIPLAPTGARGAEGWGRETQALRFI